VNKIAVVTDSNSGITQRQAKGLGISVLPMPFNIGNETFLEDINLTQDEFYERLAMGDDISTSQPSVESVVKLWKELLKTHDEIVHIPMSSGLSGSCNTAMMLAQDFDGKVEVVNNQRISVTQRQSALDAQELANAGKTAKEIKEILEKEKYDSSIYITLDTLKYIKKGGRITPAAAALGTLLRIKPVLQIQGGKLDAFAKARTVKQAKTIMIEAIQKDLRERIGKSEKAEKVHLYIAHTQNRELAEELNQELSMRYPDHDIYIDNLSLSVACHIGSGSIAVACSKLIEK